MADFPAEELAIIGFATLYEASVTYDLRTPAEELAIIGFATLYEASVTYDLRTPAEFLAGAGGASLTTYYLMIGWDSIVTTSTTVWQVTGAPDTTGASSGNPTINASTIRILKTWAA